jgi:TolA-binding protein
MSEEKKDNNFLDGHAELLNSIKKPEATPEAAEETKPTEEPEVEAVQETAEAPTEEVEVSEETVEEAEVESAEEPVTEEAAAEVSEEEEAPVEEPAAEETVEEEEAPVEEPAAEETVEEEEVTEQHVVAEVPPVVEEVPVKEPKPKKKPATPAEAKKQKHDALEKAEVKEVLTFINKYVKPAAVGIVAVCIVFLAINLMKSNKAKKVAEADAALASAGTVAEYQAVIDSYGSTPSAPLALLGLASEKFNSGDIAGAGSAYSEFLSKYPDHEMALQVEFSRIKCLEAQGNLNEAAAQFLNFKTNHADSHLAPVALLNAARCKETAGDLAGAKQVYEDVVGMYPDTMWSREAEAMLNIVEAKIK